ncbi:MucBP domain-containing protein [Enterococcus wangshanyuanii]|uniref:MucBP domain-containing protein n=1 Tax=Enterococcus wangshanyuanii TaxID=2005703 RepID=A0ABQ1NK31_9ENTE|nr:MucBP domain-containing protein [Enterococcus wangshanyuanii]GGC78984.1 hypothetical protein GCM10011573_05840 [Enterococcus wangshanyuanii]
MRKKIALLGTFLLCTAQLAPMSVYSAEFDESSQLPSTLVSENREAETPDTTQELSEQMNDGTIDQVNEKEESIVESSENLADDKNEIEKAADQQDSSLIQPLADSLGTLEQLIPNNPEAVADICGNLGILSTDEVTQEQLDTITTLRAAASGWEGFQYLTNLTELVIFTGIGHPEKDVQYLIPLTQLETLTYDGAGGNEHQLIPNGTSKKSSVDLTQFNELVDNGFPQNINFMNLDITVSTPAYKYAIPNPFINRDGSESQDMSIESPSSDISFDFEKGVFFTEADDGTLSVPTNNLIDELYFADIEWKIQYYFEKVRFNVPVYGDLVIQADPEISYDVNTTISEAAFLADIHAEYAAKMPVESDVKLTSNFLEAVDFSQPGDYKVQLDTVLAPTIDPDAKAKLVEVTVTILPEVSGDVTVKYVDTQGKSISEDIVKSGNIGENYTTEQQEIAGYTFKEVQGNATGKFTNQAQTVTYIYTKNSESVGAVTVKYVDEENQPISKDIIKTGKLGEDYTTKQQEIAGYTFKEVRGNVTGKFTNQAQTVTYVYTKNQATAVRPTPTPETPSTKGNQESGKNIGNKSSLPVLGETNRWMFPILGLTCIALTGIILLFRKRTQQS